MDFIDGFHIPMLILASLCRLASCNYRQISRIAYELLTFDFDTIALYTFNTVRQGRNRSDVYFARRPHMPLSKCRTGLYHVGSEELRNSYGKHQ